MWKNWIPFRRKTNDSTPASQKRDGTEGKASQNGKENSHLDRQQPQQTNSVANEGRLEFENQQSESGNSRNYPRNDLDRSISVANEGHNVHLNTYASDNSSVGVLPAEAKRLSHSSRILRSHSLRGPGPVKSRLFGLDSSVSGETTSKLNSRDIKPYIFSGVHGPLLSSPIVPKVRRALESNAGLRSPPVRKTTRTPVGRTSSLNYGSLNPAKSTAGRVPWVRLKRRESIGLADIASGNTPQSPNTVRLAARESMLPAAPSFKSTPLIVTTEASRSHVVDTQTVVSALREKRKRYGGSQVDDSVSEDSWQSVAKRRRQDSSQSNASSVSIPPMPESLPNLMGGSNSSLLHIENLSDQRPSTVPAIDAYLSHHQGPGLGGKMTVTAGHLYRPDLPQQRQPQLQQQQQQQSLTPQGSGKTVLRSLRSSLSSSMRAKVKASVLHQGGIDLKRIREAAPGERRMSTSSDVSMADHLSEFDEPQTKVSRQVSTPRSFPAHVGDGDAVSAGGSEEAPSSASSSDRNTQTTKAVTVSTPTRRKIAEGVVLRKHMSVASASSPGTPSKPQAKNSLVSATDYEKDKQAEFQRRVLDLLGDEQAANAGKGSETVSVSSVLPGLTSTSLSSSSSTPASSTATFTLSTSSVSSGSGQAATSAAISTSLDCLNKLVQSASSSSPPTTAAPQGQSVAAPVSATSPSSALTSPTITVGGPVTLTQLLASDDASKTSTVSSLAAQTTLASGLTFSGKPLSSPSSAGVGVATSNNVAATSTIPPAQSVASALASSAAPLAGGFIFGSLTSAPTASGNSGPPTLASAASSTTAQSDPAGGRAGVSLTAGGSNTGMAGQVPPAVVSFGGATSLGAASSTLASPGTFSFGSTTPSSTLSSSQSQPVVGGFNFSVGAPATLSAGSSSTSAAQPPAYNFGNSVSSSLSSAGQVLGSLTQPASALSGPSASGMLQSPQNFSLGSTVSTALSSAAPSLSFPAPQTVLATTSTAPTGLSVFGSAGNTTGLASALSATASSVAGFTGFGGTPVSTAMTQPPSFAAVSSTGPASGFSFTSAGPTTSPAPTAPTNTLTGSGGFNFAAMTSSSQSQQSQSSAGAGAGTFVFGSPAATGAGAGNSVFGAGGARPASTNSGQSQASVFGGVATVVSSSSQPPGMSGGAFVFSPSTGAAANSRPTTQSGSGGFGTASTTSASASFASPGSQQQQQPPPNPFGASNVAAASSVPGSSVFGGPAPGFGAAPQSSQQQQQQQLGQTNPAQPAVFASNTSANNTAGGFAFGQMAAAPVAPPSTSNTPFAFGSTAPTAPPTTSSTPFAFGSTAPASTSSSPFAFGSAAPAAPSTTSSSPFTFGSTAPAAPSSTSGSPFAFGSTAPAAPTSTSSSPFAFGSTAPAASGTSLFGAPAPQGANNLFAPAPAATSAQTAALGGSAGSVFGGGSATAFGGATLTTTASVFGGSASAAPPAFGATQNNPAAAGFGTVAANPNQSQPFSFGTSATATGKPGPAGFGASPAGTFATSSAFGAKPTASVFGSSTSNPSGPGFGATSASANAGSAFGGFSSSPAFAASPQKPSTFGTAGFGTSPSPAFGGAHNNNAAAPFGGPTSPNQPPAFGSPTVTANQGMNPSAFGGSSVAGASLFGAAKPGGFGSPASTQAAPFSFSGNSAGSVGQPPQNNAFGAQPNNAASSGFNFGQAAASPGGGGGGGFNFGAATQPSAGLGGFNFAAAAGSGGPNFNFSATPSNPNLGTQQAPGAVQRPRAAARRTQRRGPRR